MPYSDRVSLSPSQRRVVESVQYSPSRRSSLSLRDRRTVDFYSQQRWLRCPEHFRQPDHRFWASSLTKDPDLTTNETGRRRYERGSREKRRGLRRDALAGDEDEDYEDLEDGEMLVHLDFYFHLICKLKMHAFVANDQMLSWTILASPPWQSHIRIPVPFASVPLIFHIYNSEF
jgi:hypothetical protein